MSRRRADGTLRAMPSNDAVLGDLTGRARPRTSRAVATRRCLIAVGFTLSFAAVAAIAATASAGSGLVALVMAGCALAATVVVVLELRPALAGMRDRSVDAAHRRAIRAFRKDLDALPVVRHPLGM
jgi:NhaP-type Na+/H+ or K+/H+ antiporter